MNYPKLYKMKTPLLVSFLLALFTTNSVLAQKVYSSQEVNMKLLKYDKMKTKGYILTGVGLVSLGGGIALSSMADWQYTNRGGNVNYNSNDPAAIIGVLAGLAGIPMTIVGIVFMSRGSKRYKYWEQKLVVQTSYLYGVNTIGLTYRF